MQESFTEEPFRALMVGGAMTSMPNPVGAARAQRMRTGGLESGYEQPSCWLSHLPIPPCAELTLLLGLPSRLVHAHTTLWAARTRGQGAVPALAPSLSPALQT